MSATRPEAEIEDSTWVTSGLAFVGASALAVAQFTPLLKIETVARHPTVVRTVATGPHHGWALLPVAGVALVLSVITRRSNSRTASGALALLGLVTLGVALLVDLPGVHTTGIVGSGATGLRTAQAHAGIGLAGRSAAAARRGRQQRARCGHAWVAADDRPARQPRHNTSSTDTGLN